MLLSIITSSLTRPADTNTYASGDLVANSTTAGSVVPLSFALNGMSGTGQTIVLRTRLSKTNTSPANASFRLHLYEAAPVVANGDNGVWSTSKAANYLGNIDVTSMFVFTDGCTGYGAAAAGSEMRLRLSAGTALYGLLEARAAYTPGNAESFTVYLECLDFIKRMSRKSMPSGFDPMGGSRFFEAGHAEVMSVATRIHLDPGGRDLTVERIQDVEDILARNKVLRAQEQTSEWGRHIASIPCVILERWLNEEAARGNPTIRWGSREFDALVAKKLRDPDWAYLRTDKPALMVGWEK